MFEPPLDERVQKFRERSRLVHVANPDAPDRALCGFPMAKARHAAASSWPCPTCMTLAQARRSAA